jgi:hypothetical protein
MEESKADPTLHQNERRSFREVVRDIDPLPRREATDLSPEELVEISVAEWSSEP